MNKIKPEIIIILVLAIISIFLWDTFIIYPIKLFVVLLHEISHGIIAVLTGGEIIEIKITETLGGTCITKDGSHFFIAMAGYLGSLFFGAMLFISAYNRKINLWTSIILVSLLLIFSANFINGTLGLLLSLGFVILLIISTKYFNKTIHSYIMKFIGLVSCLYVVIDIKEDIISSNNFDSDAQIIAYLTGSPAILWGVLWLGISVFVLYRLIKVNSGRK